MLERARQPRQDGQRVTPGTPEAPRGGGAVPPARGARCGSGAAEGGAAGPVASDGPGSEIGRAAAGGSRAARRLQGSACTLLLIYFLSSRRKETGIVYWKRYWPRITLTELHGPC